MKATWTTKPLCEIADFQGGTQPPKSQFVTKPRSGYVRLLQIRDFKSDAKAVYIPITAKHRTCTEQDIMIGRYGASVGQIHRGKAGAYNVALIRTIPDVEQVDPDYFFHYLNSDHFQVPLSNVAERSAQAGFSKTDIAQFPVPLPCLEEQRQIVSALTETLTKLTRARENAIANLNGSHELFERVQTTIFEKASEGAEMHLLGALAEFRNGLNFSKGSKGDSIKIVGVGDFKNNFWVPMDQLKTAQIDGTLSESDCVRENDILAVRSNGNRNLIGRVMIAGNVTEPISFSGFTIRIRVTNKSIFPTYLCSLMKTVSTRKVLVAGGGGANISNLNQKLLASLKVGIPDKTVQESVLANIDECKTSTDEAMSIYSDRIANIDQLRKAIFKRAFDGDLV